MSITDVSGRFICNEGLCSPYTCEHVAHATASGEDKLPLDLHTYVLLFRSPVVLAEVRVLDEDSDGMRKVFLLDADGDDVLELGDISRYDKRRAIRALLYETVDERAAREVRCSSTYHFESPMAKAASVVVPTSGRFTNTVLADQFSMLVNGMCRACVASGGDDLVPDP